MCGSDLLFIEEDIDIALDHFELYSFAFSL
jgi:hypothetical protein